MIPEKKTLFSSKQQIKSVKILIKLKGLLIMELKKISSLSSLVEIEWDTYGPNRANYTNLLIVFKIN